MNDLKSMNMYLFRKAGGDMFDRASCLLKIKDKLKGLGVKVVSIEGNKLELVLREPFLKFHCSVFRNRSIKKMALVLARCAGLDVKGCVLIRRQPL
jgi:hypothetical protein